METEKEKNAPFPGKLKIFSGLANPDLSQKIANCLNQPLGKVILKRFSDGEFHVEYEENLRGTDVFIVQTTNQPDSHIWELLIMIYAARMASAEGITAVIPYYGYARSDRKSAPRAAIIAKMKADLITKAGANRILTMDLHAGQIQGFFDIPVDHLYAKPVLINVLKNQYNEEIKEGSLLLVAPDSGATTMTRSYAKRVGNVPIAIIDKRREAPNISEVVNIVSSVPIENKTILMIDDLVDTGGTLIGAAEALIKVGAKKIDAQATHPVLSENAIQDIKDSSISNLFVTDTIPISLLKMIDKIKIISVAPLFAEAIKEIHNNGSVSKLFLD